MIFQRVMQRAYNKVWLGVSGYPQYHGVLLFVLGSCPCGGEKIVSHCCFNLHFPKL